MRKIAFFALVSAALLVACNNSNVDNNHSSPTASAKDKKVSKRDYSITKQNAYSDLFIDSIKVENFMHKNNIADSLARRIRSFYNARNYQFAWFSSDGLAEQAFGFWSLKNYTGDTSGRTKKLEKIMDSLMANDSLSINGTDQNIVSTELLLTQSFITYIRQNFDKGYVKRKEAERFIPFKKEEPLYLADSLLNKKHKDDKYFTNINESYKNLFEQLKRYADIARNGGWPLIAADVKKYKQGKAAPEIIPVKKLLEVTGDLPEQDTTAMFNENLQKGIKNFQQRFGYTPNGILSAAVLKEMSVPVTERLKQILINMNRMRWMPEEPDGPLIVVNIPEFILHMYNGKKKEFDMAVVVGKEGHNTTIFSDKLTTIVFRPYWKVPDDIVRNEIVPAIARNANYLEKNHMKIIGDNNGLPVIRQDPGEDNSLGKVKFLFPNNFNIYFHDTPAKSLFSKNVRAFSHGCIRLSDPEKLAEYLLSDQPKWTKEKIEEAMNSGDEKFVSVKHPVPVFITYYTAWVDETGLLNFRDDIYGHDESISVKMFIK